jgi:vinculin
LFTFIFKEPSSTSGKRELIAGERGILQGVSTILLVFDESEVRKILTICRQVLEYLSITELIEKMDDLVTYVKNLTPILTKMTREINLREKELTHQIHVNLLSQHLEQVKQLVPLFISSIKTCIIIGLTFKNADSLKMRINQNKEYLIKRLTTEIKEIIRILQLTTHDEESWMCDDLTIMKQKFVRNNFYTSFYPYFNLNDYN